MADEDENNQGGDEDDKGSAGSGSGSSSSSSGENDNKGAAAGEGKPPRRQRSSDFVGPKAAKTIRGLETRVGELESERDGMKETLQRWEEKWEKLRGVKGESGKPVLEEVDEWLFGTSQSEEKE